MLPNVKVFPGASSLGQIVQTEDGLAGMLLQGPSTTLGLLEPTLITSLSAAQDLGFTANYDSVNTVSVYKHIKEFYDEAGEQASLYIMLVSQAVSMTEMCDAANPQYLKKLLDFADGKIRLLAVTRSPAIGYAANIEDGLDEDVIEAVSAVNNVALQYYNKYKPFIAFIEGRSYSGNAGELSEVSQEQKQFASVLIGDTSAGAGAAVAALLGRFAKSPVQRNCGRVKDGPVNVGQVYYADKKIEEVEEELSVLHNMGYIVFRRFVGFAGVYFSDDKTAMPSTSDFSSAARNRVFNKATEIAYTTFVEEILDDVEIDENTGRIEAATSKYYQAKIDTAVNNVMTANGEISSFRSFVDPTQNLLSTNKLKVICRITPKGYNKEIEIDLGFENPANS